MKRWLCLFGVLAFLPLEVVAVCRLSGPDDAGSYTLENELVRVRIDPARGGSVGGYVLKAAGVDVTATWQDQPVGQGFGLFVDRVVTATRERVRDYETSEYSPEVVTDSPAEATLRVTGTSPSGVGKAIQFSKLYRIRQGSCALEVDYTVANLGQSSVIASIWTCCHVRAGSVSAPLNYFYPTPKGVREERYERTPGGNNILVNDAPAAWCGAIREDTGSGLAASMDYPTLATLYTFMPGATADQDFPTLEWWTRKMLLEPINPLEGEGWAGKPWTTTMTVMPLSGLPRLDGCANGLAACIREKGTSLEVSLLSASDRAVEMDVSISKPLGEPLATKPFKFKLAAAQSQSHLVEGNWPKTGCVIRVAVRQGGQGLLECERAFGSEADLAGYLVRPRGEKLPEPKIDPLTRLTRSLETEHIKWATPSQQGKVRALFVVRSSVQREIVELAQRMDLDYSVIPTQYSHFADTSSNAGLMFYYPGYDSMGEFHAALTRGGWDVVCICSRYWSTIPERTRKLLLKRVHEGTALVNVRPYAMTADIKEAFGSATYGPGGEAICANVPLAVLPVLGEDPTGRRWVKTQEYGAGRIALLTYPTTPRAVPRGDRSAIVPAAQEEGLPEWPAHEYYYSLVCRAFLWVTRKLPEQPLRFDPVPEIRVGETARVTAHFPTEARDTLRYEAHHRSGPPVDAGTLTADASGTAVITLPECRRAGTLFIDVWQMHDGRIVDWGTATVEVLSPIQSVTVRAPEEACEAGKTYTLPVAIEAGSDIDQIQLRVTVTDAHSRCVWQAETTVDVRRGMSERSLSFRIDNPLTVRHRIVASVHRDDCELGTGEAVVYARLPEVARDYTFLVWEGGWRSHVLNTALEQLKRIGMTEYQIGANATRRRRPTNRGLRTSCDEILRHDLALSLMSVNWIGGYPAKDNPLARLYCLHDPEYVQHVKDGIAETLAGLDRLGVRTASTGDEISIGRYSGFNDFCQSEHTVRAFRQWLAPRYGSIEALNRVWDTSYGTFDEIPGIRWEDVEGRPNKAAWVEFRTHMEVSLTDYLKMFHGEMQKVIPGVKAGFDGNTALCSYNGFDWWRISGVCDMITLYRTAAAEHFLGSFFRTRGVTAHFSMWHSTSRGRALAHSPWDLLLKGMTGVDYWYAPLLLNPDFTLNEYATKLGAGVREIQSGIGMLVLQATRRHDPIGILYSQASVHAATIEGFRGRPGARGLNQDHFAWSELLADAGYTPEYISYEQLAQGFLAEHSYRVLVLPLCYALSDQEAAQIREFVRSGGLLIADSGTGRYDGHGRALEHGQLDDLLGVKRVGTLLSAGAAVTINMPEEKGRTIIPWAVPDRDIRLTTGKAMGRSEVGSAGQETVFGGMRLTTPATSEEAVPTVIGGGRGSGQTFYLNLPIWRYRELRGTARGQEVVGLLSTILGQAGLSVAVPCRNDDGPVPELITTRFTWGEGVYVGLVKAMNSRSGATDGTLTWQAPGFVYDVRSKQFLGRQEETALKLSEERPTVLAQLPYKTSGIKVSAAKSARSLVAPGGNLGPCVARSWMVSCPGGFRAYWSTCGERRNGWAPRAGNPTGRAFLGRSRPKEQTLSSNQKAGQPFGRVPGCDHPPGRSTPIFISPYDRPGGCSSTIHPRMGPNSRRAPLAATDVRVAVVASQGTPTHHVIRCTVHDPSGNARACYARNIIAKSGEGTYRLVFALNDPPGVWKITCTDVVSGASADVQVRHDSDAN